MNRRRDNEASSSANVLAVVEAVDDRDSDSPMLNEEDGKVAVTKELVQKHNYYDKLEAMKYKQVHKEKTT